MKSYEYLLKAKSNLLIYNKIFLISCLKKYQILAQKHRTIHIFTAKHKNL